MPTYEYACKSCGDHLEVVQSFKDAALTECPACGGPLRKVFGSIGIAFKGSGFYKTDSRSSSKPAPSATSGAGTSDSAKSDSAKSDSAKSDSGGTPSKSDTASSKPANGSSGSGAAAAS